MNIAVVSLFRNMVGRIDPYMAQIDTLQRHVWLDSTDHTVRVIAVTGDNTDATEDELQVSANRYRVPLSIVKCNHGLQVFPSCEDPNRLAALTKVLMAGMRAVSHDKYGDDVVLYVESDLIWNPHQVGSIIDMAYRRDGYFDIIAPMIFCGDGSQFYDVWGFRHDGARFSWDAPYTHDLLYGGITELDSVGSCFACRAKVAEKVTPIGKLALVSWCNGARAQGYQVGVAQGFRVSHP